MRSLPKSIIPAAAVATLVALLLAGCQEGTSFFRICNSQVVVDTLGFPMAVSVHEASIHDSKGAESALEKLAHKFPRLKKILANGGYRGDELKEMVRKTLGCQLEVVLRPDESPKKFNVIPLRWIVERSFAWLYNFRRIALDYEFHSESTEAMIQIAFSKIMLNKLSN